MCMIQKNVNGNGMTNGSIVNGINAYPPVQLKKKIKKRDKSAAVTWLSGQAVSIVFADQIDISCFTGEYFANLWESIEWKKCYRYRRSSNSQYYNKQIFFGNRW